MPDLTIYQDVRPNILTGDAILWKSTSCIGKMIQWWTEFNHASLVVRMKEYEGLSNRVFLVEALSHGLKLTLLSHKLENFSGEAYWLSVEMNQNQIENTREFALIECAKTKGYDYPGLFANIFGRISLDARNYICSEWVWWAWIASTMLPKPGKNLKAPRPGDLRNWVSWAKLTQIYGDK